MSLISLANAQLIGYSQGLGSIPLPGRESAQVVVGLTDATPVAFTVAAAAINSTTNIFTKAAHGLPLGTVLQIVEDNTLPGGLAEETDYFVIPLDDGSFQLADSLVHAQAGTAKDLTNVGVLTNTYTPTAADGVKAKLRGSLDNETWVDIEDSETSELTLPVNTSFSIESSLYPYEQVYVSLDTGVVRVTAKTFLKS